MNCLACGFRNRIKYSNFFTATWSVILYNKQKRNVSVKGSQCVLLYETKYTAEEQQQILKTLNQTPLEGLYQFNATKSRLKSIDHWRLKHGPFFKVTDVLEVDGLGVKVFEKLCDSILGTDEILPVMPSVTASYEKELKGKRHMLIPVLDESDRKIIKSGLGLHLTPTGISWSRLEREGNFLNLWNFYDFTQLPKKLLTSDIYQLALSIFTRLPPADIYIFESSQQLSPQAKSSQKQHSSSYTQQLELTAMIMTLLNTNISHSPNFQMKLKNDDLLYANKVYYLKPHLPARLFSTLVGNEKVAATEVIENLLHLKERDTKLPCTNLECSDDLIDYYSKQTAIQRHLLGQSLLLVISFMELCVNKNPESLKAIMLRNKK